MELTIKNVVYQFKASFGFLRAVNKQAQAKVSGTEQKQDIGLKVLVAKLLDGNAEALLNALNLLNAGMEPRVTEKDLEVYLEEDTTDIDGLFDAVLDFLSQSNTTKREVTNFLQEIEKEMAKENLEALK